MPTAKRTRPLPLMFINKFLCLKRNQNFDDYLKFAKLDAIVKGFGGKGERRSFWCDLREFADLLFHLYSLENSEYIRVYIASYDNSVDEDLFGKLTLIFCACKRNYEDIEEYFYFNETSKIFEKGTDKANRWVKFYQEKKLMAIADTLTPHDPRKLGDTTSFLYSNDRIFDLLQEIDYQIRRDDREVFGINIHFGAFDQTEVRYKKRLITGFTFAKRDGSDIYIEDMADIDATEFDKLINDDKEKSFKISGQLDTGTPCPPNTCTGTSLPKP